MLTPLGITFGPSPLAQQGAGSDTTAVVGVLIWVGVLIVLAIVTGLILVALRSRLFGSGQSGGQELTVMESLQRLRDQGKLSESEFQRTRESLLRSAPTEPVQATADATKSDPLHATIAGQRAPEGGTTQGDPSEQELRAQPGYDLAGDPLPGHEKDGNRDPG